MKNNNLGLSLNIFSSSKGKKYKEKYIKSEKATSSKAIVPLHMSLMQLKRGHKKKVTEGQLRKKTNRIFKLHKKDKNRKPLKDIKKELDKKILGKYANPYIKNIRHMVSIFSKEKKLLYYDYYQIDYIMNKKRCDLYTKYKDYKLIYDNQEYFFKFFTTKESKVYLTHLLYVTYSKDPFVKSTRAACINKDLKKVKSEYNEYIIKNVFEAKRLILSRDLNKYMPNLPPKLYEVAQQKLSRIAIPKYKIIVKPVLATTINYIYIRDVPYSKIPKTIPNYSKIDKQLYTKIKSFVIKKKFSVLLINGKKVPKGKDNKKYMEKELSRDINILYSVRTNNSDDDDYVDSSNLYKTRYNIDINQVDNNFRNKKNKDINDIESLIFRMSQKPIKKEVEEEDEENNIIHKSNLESLNTIHENDDSEVFLSSLKKPFIGNRDDTKSKKVTFNEMKRTKQENKKKNEDLLLYTMNYLKSNNNKGNNYNKKKYKLYLDLNEDEFNFNKKSNLINNENIVKTYFPERYIDPEKYREYLIKSPFVKTVYNISSSFTPNNNLNKNKVYHLLANNLKENNKSVNSFSFDKNNFDSFKPTYKFLLGYDKKEKREELINYLINKSNKIYQQIQIINEAENKMSGFKKSGPLAFTSFKGIKFDKKRNEWDRSKNFFKRRYGKNDWNTILLRKIDKENYEKDENFKKCDTFNQILKKSNVYL